MTLLTSYFYPLDWGPSRSKQVSGGKEAEMTERDAAEAISQKLCEKFKLDGEREYENAFTLGGDLGFTEDEIRNALWIFRTDGQRCVQIDQIKIERVRLTTLGIQRCKAAFPSYRP